MKNSSDIFFLKESENPGNDLWSIKGTNPMKIKRRPSTAQNECFEYGRNNFCPQHSDIKDEESGIQIDSSQEPSVITPSDSVSTPAAAESPSQPKRFVRKHMARQLPDDVAVSKMARNPITGYGIDLNSYRFPK